MCALAFEIASLKYENYCPWLRSVSLATVGRTFLIFQASFLSAAGSTQPPASEKENAKKREREGERQPLLSSRCSLVTNARIANVVCFDLFSHGKNISARQFVRVNQLAKSEPFNIFPFFLLESSAPCVRACVHACVRSFRVVNRGSLTFELSNRRDATVHPNIILSLRPNASPVDVDIATRRSATCRSAS